VNAHTVLWTSPTPLWGRFGSYSAADQPRPSILRFASDEFMEQLLAMLAADPGQLGGVIARPETWRNPGGDTPDLIDRVPLPRIAKTLARLRRAEAPTTALQATASVATSHENNVERQVALKLYQPAHQRHYLVAANLVCGVPGFPDRAIATGGREQIGFVLRRLLVPNGSSSTDREEFAFVKDSSGARWQRIGPTTDADDQGGRLVDGEELLPLFPLTFNDDRDHQRRLLAGVIPVGRREEYMTTSARADLTPIGASNPAPVIGGNSADATLVSARKEQLKMDVVEPWKNLARTAFSTAARIEQGKPDSELPDPNPKNTARTRFNNQLQTQSWLVLLDFADYLSQHLPDVWGAIGDSSQRAQLTQNGKRLFDWLNSAGSGQSASKIPIDGTGQRAFASSLRDALKKVRQDQATRDGIEGAVRSYPDDPNADATGALAWPSFLFPLAWLGPNGTGTTQSSGVHESLSAFSSINGDDVKFPGTSATGSQQATEASVALLDKLVQLVITAIDTSKPSAPTSPVPFAAKLRDALATTKGDEGWFVLRCVYVRCDCGPLQPTVLSARSQQFQLASFFDPDAPARPIRIALPFDTTPAGLRKFNKNTAFVMSDVLCGQVQRAKGLGFIDLVLSVLPWPLHKDLDVGGMGPCGEGTPFGMICSLSIPIITICALILLIIIVTLLDLIFRWLPFFIICFPVPGLKGKAKVPTP
jgi:hypothetical protein